MTIRIITAPSIYLIGRQEIDPDELRRFLDDIEAPDWDTDAPSPGEALAEVAGRVCYNSFRNPRPGGNGSYLSHIIESRHGRVTEHAVWTLVITGISRSLSHELYTHTVGISKSMQSQRYVDESECAFVVPPALIEVAQAAWGLYEDRKYPPMLPRKTAVGLRWLNAIHEAHQSYMDLAEYLEETSTSESKTDRRKAAREAARSILPNCVETRVCLTGNCRAFRNLIEQRSAPGADAEFRRLSIALLDVLRTEAPHLFGDYSVSPSSGAATASPKV